MEITEEAKVIAQQIYSAFGSESGILFGISNRRIVEVIIQFTLDKASASQKINEGKKND